MADRPYVGRVGRFAVPVLVLVLGFGSGHGLARALLRSRANRPAQEPRALLQPQSSGIEGSAAVAPVADAAPPSADSADEPEARARAARMKALAEALGMPTAGLHGAALRGDLAFIQAELAQGVSVDLPDAAGRTPLTIAGFAGQLEVFEALIRAGASLTHATYDGRTPLMYAAVQDQAAVVRRLLELKARPDVHDRLGDTALIMAARREAASAAQALLDGGARIDAQGASGMTALMYAARSPPGPLLSLLLGRHAALEQRDRRGATALCIAADALQPATVAALLDAGAKIDAANHAGLTALGFALSLRTNLSADQRARADEVAEILAVRGASFRLLHSEAVIPTLDRKRFDALAFRHSEHPLPGGQVEAVLAAASHVAITPGGASTRLFALRRRVDSRSVAARVDDAYQIRVWGQAHAALFVQQVRIRDLQLRPRQRVVLAGDPAGQWGFSVDDVLLFEGHAGSRVRTRAYVGVAEELTFRSEPITQLGYSAFQFGADEIQIGHLLKAGDDLVVSLLDWGGHVMNSDVFLRVLGPGAVQTLNRARIEAMP